MYILYIYFNKWVSLSFSFKRFPRPSEVSWEQSECVCFFKNYSSLNIGWWWFFSIYPHRILSSHAVADDPLTNVISLGDEVMLHIYSLNVASLSFLRLDPIHRAKPTKLLILQYLRIANYISKILCPADLIS